ncbi:hypothetical protein [Halosimplex sp. TS25]
MRTGGFAAREQTKGDLDVSGAKRRERGEATERANGAKRREPRGRAE